MVQGVIIKALSGFYYVAAGDQIVECKARGRFRYDGCSPLVGDRVQLSFDAHGKGRIEAVEQRRNAFIRPAVANIDQLIMIGANVNPITDPFLIDRVVAIAENAGCEPVVCLNKCDLDPAEHLYDIYRSIGFRVLRTSAATGLGLDALRDALRGKTSAFTGNSGVGKSSISGANFRSLQAIPALGNRACSMRSTHRSALRPALSASGSAAASIRRAMSSSMLSARTRLLPTRRASRPLRWIWSTPSRARICSMHSGNSGHISASAAFVTART